MAEDFEDEEETTPHSNLPVLTFRDRSANVHVGQVMVETGRGNAIAVDIGAPVEETLDRIANQCNYGGDYRVFLQGTELLEPGEIPFDPQTHRQTFQAGQRWSITAYDKPGR